MSTLDKLRHTVVHMQSYIVYNVAVYILKEGVELGDGRGREGGEGKEISGIWELVLLFKELTTPKTFVLPERKFLSQLVNNFILRS